MNSALTQVDVFLYAVLCGVNLQSFRSENYDNGVIVLFFPGSKRERDAPIKPLTSLDAFLCAASKEAHIAFTTERRVRYLS